MRKRRTFVLLVLLSLVFLTCWLWRALAGENAQENP